MPIELINAGNMREESHFNDSSSKHVFGCGEEMYRTM